MSGSGVRLTERDMTLLSFVADHRLVLAAHVQALLDISAGAAYRRLHALTESGYLRQRTRFHHEPSCYQIQRTGLAALGSRAGTPRIDLNCYAHDIGVAWLWLAARAGRFGPMREVLSERRLRSADATPGRDGDPLAVRLGGYGPGGRRRLHYPDLLLVTPGDHRIAVELELTAKGRSRREKILSGYAFDGRVSAVLYLAERATIARAVISSARRMGIADLIHVQRVRSSDRERRGRSAAFDRAHSMTSPPGAARDRGGTSEERAR